MDVKPTLFIRVESNLSKMSFYVKNKENLELLCVIRRPKLLWDPITLSEKGCLNKVAGLFGKNTLISFDNIQILWNDLVWPPSIDSFLFSKCLKEESYLNKQIKKVADVGCGTGFLGIYITKNNPYVEKLYGIDINEQALLSTMENASLNFVQDKIEVVLSDCYDNIPENVYFDLVVCNPPYVPLPPHRDLNFQNFAGTYLIEKILSHSAKRTKELIILYSNISADIVNNIESKSRRRSIILKKRVPFRLPAVLNDKEWLNYLIDRGLIKKNDKYCYWHELIIEKYVYE
jgi:predicted RNA methylase